MRPPRSTEAHVRDMPRQTIDYPTPLTPRVELTSLLQKTAQRDVNAFHQLYSMTHRRLFTILMRILRNHALAEDALQEVFLKIWQRAERYNADLGAPLVWMAIIARNTALDHVRASKPAIDQLELLSEPESVAMTEPSDRNLEKALMALPLEQRKALVLMHTYGFSHSELADHMKVPLGTAKSWVRRGTEALRTLLRV